MQRPNDLGQLKPGFLADIVMIAENPLDDLSILTDPAKIVLVMKDGVIHRDICTQAPDDAALHYPGADFPLREEGIKEALASTTYASRSPRRRGSSGMRLSDACAHA